MTAIQFKDHPVWKDILEYNIEDKEQSQVAFMVYLKLCEDQNWWNVSTHFCEELSMVFLSGHASRNKPREIILPVSVETKLSPAQIQKYLGTIRLPDQDKTNSVLMAICGGDSGTVYYRLTSGLVPPEQPELTEWKKYRRDEMPDLRRHHVSQQTSMYVTRKQSKLLCEEDGQQNDT